jgi:hypothetical protein
MSIHKAVDCALQMPIVIIHEVDVVNVVNDATLPSVPRLVNAVPRSGFPLKDGVSGLFKTG